MVSFNLARTSGGPLKVFRNHERPHRPGSTEPKPCHFFIHRIVNLIVANGVGIPGTAGSSFYQKDFLSWVPFIVPVGALNFERTEAARLVDRAELPYLVVSRTSDQWGGRN